MSEAVGASPQSLARKEWVVVQQPEGPFRADRDIKLREISEDELKELRADEVALKIEALSVDAFIRTMLDAGAFHGSRNPGELVPALGVGTVIQAGEEASSKFPIGTRVSGLVSAGTIAITSTSNPSVRAVPEMLSDMPPSLHLGMLGVSGSTAYTGIFLASGKPPQCGETVVISAAAGATGSLAAQMAILTGARVVGVAGGPEKCRFLLEELGVEAVVDYKSKSKSIEEQLAEACPDGIDFMFDNVGGEILDAVLEKINLRARIVICGAISQYDTGKMYEKGGVRGPSNYTKLAEKSATMSGFVVTHYMTPEVAVEFMTYILGHYHSGKIKPYQHFENGIEKFSRGLEMLFNNGKQIGRLIIDIDGKSGSAVP